MCADGKQIWATLLDQSFFAPQDVSYEIDGGGDKKEEIRLFRTVGWYDDIQYQVERPIKENTTPIPNASIQARGEGCRGAFLSEDSFLDVANNLTAYYAQTLNTNPDNLTYRKRYWIDEKGNVDSADINLFNPNVDKIEDDDKEWRVAQGCNGVKQRILGNADYIGDAYDCFVAYGYRLKDLSEVVDISAGGKPVRSPLCVSQGICGDTADIEGHHLLVSLGGQRPYHAFGRHDWAVDVFDMFQKQYDRTLVDTGRPQFELKDIQITDNDNNGTTDKIRAEWAIARGDFYIPQRTFYTEGALALFDPLLKKAEFDEYQYVSRTLASTLDVHSGEVVYKGEKLFTFDHGRKIFTAERDCVVEYASNDGANFNVYLKCE